jgi:hypothetical protein
MRSSSSRTARRVVVRDEADRERLRERPEERRRDKRGARAQEGQRRGRRGVDDENSLCNRVEYASERCGGWNRTSLCFSQTRTRTVGTALEEGLE